MEGKCKQFYCKERKGKYCCYDCEEKCLKCCYNNPERCGFYEVKDDKD